MTEKPIIFSTPLIPAIQNLKPNTWPPEPIDPRKPFKWKSRRVIKPQPPSHTYNGTPYTGYQKTTLPGKQGYDLTAFCDNPLYIGECPYPPGTILWVKETWCDAGVFGFAYRATDTLPVGVKGWCSPRFMPKRAARLFLEVQDVRVEKLQEITEEDAKAEGIRWTKEGPLHAHLYDAELDAYLNFPTAKEVFKYLWNSIYGKKYPWESNPWVWVISFERVENYG